MNRTGSLAKDIVQSDLPKILAGDGKVLVDSAERLGKELASKNGMKVSQIRKIFAEMQRITEFDEYRINMMRARLAYVAGRHKEVAPLENVLTEALAQISDEDQLDHVKDFFEAIVAYHKRAGGSE